MWANFVKHTKKEEDKIWDIDYISDEILDETPLTSHVLTVTGESTTDSSD